MANFIGQEGTITQIGTPNITWCVENWQITIADDVQDVTTVCSMGWVSRINGIFDATLTFSIFYDDSLTPITSLVVATPISFTAKIANTDRTISGDFYVSDFVIQNPAKNPVKCDVTCKITGPLSYDE